VAEHGAESGPFEVGHDISEVINSEDCTGPSAARSSGRLRDIEPQMVLDSWAKSRRRNARCKVRRDGREDIATVERAAYGPAEKLLRRNFTDPVFRVGIQDHCENTVIGSDESKPESLGEQRPPRTADAWIHHDQMHSSLRKTGRRLRKRISTFGNFIGGRLMRYVDQTRLRADSNDDALHGRDVVIARAEVGQQSDDRLLHC